MTGNSAQVFDVDLRGNDYILGPGFDYWMEYRIEAWLNNDSLLSTDPPPVLTFEFGGVSPFAGVDASIVGTVLPEPSARAISALASAGALWYGARRRRPGAAV